MRLAPGPHDIVFEFNPKSLRVTNTLGLVGVNVIYVLCAAALAFWISALVRGRKHKEDAA